MKVYTDLFDRTANYSLTKEHILYLKNSHKIEITTEFDDSIEIYWGDRFKIEYLKLLPNLKWIHLSKTGIDKFQLPTGIIVTNTPKSSAGVDEYALSIILFFLRNLYNFKEIKNSTLIDRNFFDQFIPFTKLFKNTSCLVVGSGAIGKGLYIKLSNLGFKTNIINRKKFSNLHKVVKTYDFIINCLPLTNETRLCFDQNIFATMKSTAIFINVGRGETVNEDDLINALSTEKIRAAFLDVISNEPITLENKFINTQNLFISPHIANSTNLMLKTQVEEFVKNFKKYIKNKPLKNIIKNVKNNS
jgi:phosphoglycerate dehydrogenase-like enzyme